MKRTLLVHRRPDGVIELRRHRLRDSPAFRDAAVPMGLCVGSLAFIALVGTLLVETPTLLLATVALVLPMALALVLGRQPGLVPASARQPRQAQRSEPDGAA